MTKQQFRALMEALPMESWPRIKDGETLCLADDARLEVKAAGAPMEVPLDTDPETAEALREANLAASDAIYDAYYRGQPLTAVGFRAQLEGLFEKHGEAGFAAESGAYPEHTLFVDGGELIAESRQGPRFRYGTFLELNQPLDEAKRTSAVRQWADSNSAYEQYLSANVCRYNC
ncbi:MAG: hypothetical protein ACPG4N_01455 [Gammaproteobacteria bacterium]